MRVCIVFSDIGHYHHPRFTAVAERLNGELHVLELGGESSYGEFKSTRTNGCRYELQTLFSGTRYVDVVSGRGVAAKELNESLSAALEQASPDVIVLKGYSFLDSLLALSWARRHQVPVVVMSESHGGDFQRIPWKEWMKRQLLGDVSAALVGGRPHALYMHSLGVPRDRIFMGYDVVDNAHFADGAVRARQHDEEERTRHALPRRYILASGRFIPKKDFASLMIAFAQYRKRAEAEAGFQWELVILGDGEERSNLEKLRGSLGCENAVHMPGFRGYNDLPSYYGLADLFVHPSQREQWGLVVNEAMACGLPVLATERCGCARDLVIDGKTGFQFRVGDQEQLADYLLLLWRDEALRERLGRAAERRIAAFSPGAFAKGFENACRCAMESPRWGRRPWQDLVGAVITRRTILFPVDENLS